VFAVSAASFSWLLVTAGLIGTVMNARHDRRCFYIWAPSNLGLCGVNAITGQWAQALLFFVNFWLALYGLYAWQRRQALMRGK